MKCDTCFCRDLMYKFDCRHYKGPLSIWQILKVYLFGCEHYISDCRYEC